MADEELIKTIELEQDGKIVKVVLVQDVLNLMLLLESQANLFDDLTEAQQKSFIIKVWQTLKQELANKLEKIK